jgi:hypothetical protein
MKFTGNNRGIRVAILLLIVLFALGAAGYCSRSDAEEPCNELAGCGAGEPASTSLDLKDDKAEGLSIGFGFAAAGGEPCFGAMLIAQEFGERRWLAFLSTHGDSNSCRDDEPIRANIGGGIVRTTHLGKWAIGFGLGVLEHGDVIVGPKAVTSSPYPRTADRLQLCANILIRRHLFRDRAVADVVHCSSGNSTVWNRGLNTITLGIRF